MATEKIRKFLEILGTDAKALLNDGKLPQSEEEKMQAILRLAKEKGFDLTPANLENYLRETVAARKEKTEAQAEKVVKLADSDLEKAAGGALWDGEDAPDGHELGCLIFYHGVDWQREHDYWCDTMYYCSETYQFTDSECPHGEHSKQ